MERNIFFIYLLYAGRQTQTERIFCCFFFNFIIIIINLSDKDICLFYHVIVILKYLPLFLPFFSILLMYSRTNMKMDNIGLTGHTFANHHHDYNRHHRHQIRSNNDNYYPSYQTAKLFTGLLDNDDDDDESNHPAHNTRTLSSSSSSLYSLNNSCRSRINIDGHFFLMIIIILMIYIRIHTIRALFILL